ncbi:MAG: glycoside hydrolase N-terminal domain-containing protein [Clostridia bacterium]|nr:glycoside hydrolase N-terminal domain-containing protein [Clostridia bacterium]
MEKLLRYGAPAKHFEEALPLGNGQLGAMVYGGCDVERISLNHDTLWSGKPGDVYVDGAFESNERAKKLLNEDKRYEAQRELENNFTGEYLSSYMILGALYIKRIDASGKPTKYIRTLDMEKGIATVKYTEDGIDFEREVFVSYPDNCIMVKINSSAPATYEIYGDCVGKSHVTAWNDTLYFTGECPTSLAPSYCKAEKPVVYDGDGVKVSALAKVKTDGAVEHDASSRVRIDNATSVALYFCAETSFVAFDKLPDKKTFEPCMARLNELFSKDYEAIKRDHVADFSSMFNKVVTDFGGEESQLYTNERLMAKEKDLGLCELLYNFGRYLIISASREGSRSTNLQGIWNESYYAPWSSNYTLNINAEMNYWPVLMSNLVSCNLPIIELAKCISINGRETARRLYHAEGFTCHHNSDLWAHTTPVGAKKENSSQYAYWNMSGGWLMRHLYEHYEYTLDKEYLKEVAYPIMKECAKFYLSIMEKYEDKWIITPSTSPENSYIQDGKLIYLAKYTVMTQSIAEDVFKNLSKASEILGIDDEFTRIINERKDHIGIYKKGSEGQLLEYDDEFEESDIYHRHVSHLYAFYPADIITTDNNPEVARMVRRSLERRGDEGTGWSMGWKVCLWAKLKDGDRALKLVKNQLRFMPAEPDESVDMWHSGGTYANMFDAHPPFQIDGNYGVCAGIAQMFLQCEDGKVKILPALPSEMKNGSIKGLLAKGNITVDIEWKNNKLSQLKLVTPIKQTAIISIDGVDKAIALEANKEYIFA